MTKIDRNQLPTLLKEGRKLEACGCRDVHNYGAGKADWTEAGLPIEKAA